MFTGFSNLKRKGMSDGQTEINYAKVKRWTKSIDLFNKEYIFIPICENEHWSLAIICKPYKAFEIMNDHLSKMLKEDKKHGETS